MSVPLVQRAFVARETVDLQGGGIQEGFWEVALKQQLSSATSGVKMFNYERIRQRLPVLCQGIRVCSAHPKGRG